MRKKTEIYWVFTNSRKASIPTIMLQIVSIKNRTQISMVAIV